MTDDNWSKFRGVFEPKTLFKTFMDPVGKIRNQLAHFRGRLTLEQRDTLRRARQWLEMRPRLELPQELAAQIITITEDDVEQNREPAALATDDTPLLPPDAVVLPRLGEKYRPLYTWLVEQAAQDATRIQVSFQDIEKLLGDALPPSASEHRSWWANDTTTHTQAQAWLQAGWRVEDANFSTRTVTFQRTNSAWMQAFFADLLERLKQARPGITRAKKIGPGNSWWFGAGRTDFSFYWALSRERLVVAINIETPDRARNKEAFDRLKEQQDAIEAEIGMPLNWERGENWKVSSVSVTRPTRSTDSPEELEQAKQWALEMTLKFADAFQPRIKALP